MSSHEVEVTGQTPLCADVVSVRVQRPGDFSFEPGQYLTLKLQTTHGQERKPFTISSAADAPYLEITTRMSGSAFKRALEGAVPGTPVTIAGPFGRLILPRDTKRVAFLVGGVGITPVASMVRTWRERGQRPEAIVFYGNRELECMPLADELAPGPGEPLTLVTVPERADQGWRGERGFITAETVRRHMNPADGWLFVVAGPPGMVGAMEECLRDVGSDPEEALIERFGPQQRPGV